MTNKKYIYIMISIMVLLLIGVSFMFISVYLYINDYGHYWFPFLFTSIPIFAVIIILIILYIYRKELKTYYDEKYIKKIRNTNISLICNNIGNDPCNKISDALVKSNFMQVNGNVFKKLIYGDDAYDEEMILFIFNQDINDNLVQTVNEKIKKIELGPMTSRKVNTLILFFEELESEKQNKLIRVVKESMLHKETLNCPVLFVDESNGNIYYFDSDKKFMFVKSSLMKIFLKIK